MNRPRAVAGPRPWLYSAAVLPVIMCVNLAIIWLDARASLADGLLFVGDRELGLSLVVIGLPIYAAMFALQHHAVGARANTTSLGWRLHRQACAGLYAVLVLCAGYMILRIDARGSLGYAAVLGVAGCAALGIVLHAIGTMIGRFRRTSATRGRNVSEPRFTEGVQAALALARNEVAARGHDYVGTEHLLIGLMLRREGAMARVLDRLGKREALRRALDEIMLPGTTTWLDPERIPCTSRSSKLLQQAVSVAQAQQRDRTGRTDLLLVLSADEKGLAGRVLREAGITRAAIVEALRDGP